MPTYLPHFYTQQLLVYEFNPTASWLAMWTSPCFHKRMSDFHSIIVWNTQRQLLFQQPNSDFTLDPIVHFLIPTYMVSKFTYNFPEPIVPFVSSLLVLLTSSPFKKASFVSEMHPVRSLFVLRWNIPISSSLYHFHACYASIKLPQLLLSSIGGSSQTTGRSATVCWTSASSTIPFDQPSRPQQLHEQALFRIDLRLLQALKLIATVWTKEVEEPNASLVGNFFIEMDE